MGKGYLTDTNILIYYLADAIPKEGIDRVEEILKTSFNVSIITKIEFLGWRGHTEEGFKKAEEFINFARIIPLTNEIANLTIDLSREYRIKLPDAVIAATALYHDLTLVTRNEKDFKGIKGLEIYNPFKSYDEKS